MVDAKADHVDGVRALQPRAGGRRRVYVTRENVNQLIADAGFAATSIS